MIRQHFAEYLRCRRQIRRGCGSGHMSSARKVNGAINLACLVQDPDESTEERAMERPVGYYPQFFEEAVSAFVGGSQQQEKYSKEELSKVSFVRVPVRPGHHLSRATRGESQKFLAFQAHRAHQHLATLGLRLTSTADVGRYSSLQQTSCQQFRARPQSLCTMWHNTHPAVEGGT